MICSDKTRAEVAGGLTLNSIPAPVPTWARHVYSCTYSLPMGRLVLSVTVTPSDAAAQDQLAYVRGQVGATDAETGLGQRAYSAPTGTVIAMKDNMVLRVDAAGLPDDLTDGHESRLEFARVITAEVFECWTGS